jgi:hypothetical protein
MQDIGKENAKPILLRALVRRNYGRCELWRSPVPATGMFVSVESIMGRSVWLASDAAEFRLKCATALAAVGFAQRWIPPRPVLVRPIARRRESRPFSGAKRAIEPWSAPPTPGALPKATESALESASRAGIIGYIVTV